ncbi:MAG: CvpA family protein [Clostridiales bacterium]|nr:CvpA family protein [Clostridiales bacterium]
MKLKIKLLLTVLAVIAAAVYYYVTIPALNIHSGGFWVFIISLVIVLTILFGSRKLKDGYALKEVRSLKVGFVITGILVVIYVAGSILSSPIVNAKKYHSLLPIQEGNFTEDIEEVDYNEIPLLDKNSAELLGNRKMGSLVDMVSQFEVSSLYTQINYQGKPVRVTPLVYASPIKWLTNMSEGIPAYMMIDMTTQDTECVRLENGGIRYSQAEYFNRNIYRHLRFRYPTFIFDKLSFEIDEEGTPYWICPVKKYNIGLFGGQTIGKVVLCNAVTGETSCYEIEDCPQWVDSVYSASLLIQLYDYYGLYTNGFFNSVLGQKGCLQTTDGYNYLAMEDDVWVYTGITSVSGDQSNVGFVLMNQRTMEARYYSCPGAEEYSAMYSAEGQVQNLGYHATFPLLLNVADEPTYFMALKDDAGLVKKYAMVNITKYQNVAIGDTVADCEKSYINLLKTNGITKEPAAETEKVSGIIETAAPVVLEGTSHYYVVLTGRDMIFDVNVSEFPQMIRYKEGDQITLEYTAGEELQNVVGIL